MIRRYQPEDYEDVIALLKAVDLPLVTEDELDGFGFVYVDNDQLLGFTWALIGEGATVFIDHFAVHPNSRDQKEDRSETGRSRIAVSLMLTMLGELNLMGKTRITGVLQQTPYGLSLERTYNKVGMKFTEPHAFVYGNIKDIFDNLVKVHNGSHRNHTAG